MNPAARWLLAAAVIGALAVAAADAHADRGVGVNLGRIRIEDHLKPGGSYSLPVLGVVNTGDEPSEYEVVINHLQGEDKLPPPPGWFSVQPDRFSLEPGRVQTVRIRLTLPTEAEPGDYFAFIEAHLAPTGGAATVGAAAATQLSFTVKPSSWLQAQRVRVNRWIDGSEPWSYVVPGLSLVALGLLTVRRFFRIGL
jgi:hypothetical protein